MKTEWCNSIPFLQNSKPRTLFVKSGKDMPLKCRRCSPPVGPILYYVLLRDGMELFRGTSLSFSDTKGIQPFQEYSYQLKACTVAGCATSSQVWGSASTGDGMTHCDDNKCLGCVWFFQWQKFIFSVLCYVGYPSGILIECECLCLKLEITGRKIYPNINVSLI